MEYLAFTVQLKLHATNYQDQYITYIYGVMELINMNSGRKDHSQEPHEMEERKNEPN